MRRLTATLLAAIALPTAGFAADCNGEVTAAFEKQRTSKGYRVVSLQAADVGQIKIEIDYQGPDRMMQKLMAPDQPAPVETIAIGRWAWGNHGGGFQELQPQFAQSVTAHVHDTLAEPVQAATGFTCLGKVSVDGKEYIGYRTEPKARDGRPEGPDNPKLARTVYVDPTNGLPALNIVGEVRADAPLLFKAAYSYPDDILVEAPVGALPASKIR